MAIIGNRNFNGGNKSPGIDCLDIEIAVADFFDWKRNLIVPNVWWGIGLNHEADLLIVTASGYATEVEIKVSLNDLKADAKKKNPEHLSEKIKRLYFAVPIQLRDIVKHHIPNAAGILVAERYSESFCKIYIDRLPKSNKCAERLSIKDISKLRDLAAMRIWTLKKHINKKRTRNC